MSVPEFLATHTSREISEYRAYEIVAGPIGPAYERETLAMLHEQIQRLCAIMIAVNQKEEDDTPEVTRLPRAYDWFKPYEDED